MISEKQKRIWKYFFSQKKEEVAEKLEYVKEFFADLWYFLVEERYTVYKVLAAIPAILLTLFGIGAIMHLLFGNGEVVGFWITVLTGCLGALFIVLIALGLVLVAATLWFVVAEPFLTFILWLVANYDHAKCRVETEDKAKSVAKSTERTKSKKRSKIPPERNSP